MAATPGRRGDGDEMEESKDAERLLPALALVPDALAVIVVLAERNVSSAYGACKGIGKVTASRAEFLEDMRLLAETVGISSVGGSASTTSPGLYRGIGLERAREFVKLAAECALEYGQSAGQAFLERKTAASAQTVE